jgi:alkylated DNA repair protein (DNA oxidative demethylase)
MTPDLFKNDPHDRAIADGAVLLGGFARPEDAALLAALDAVAAAAPFRRMTTPGGFSMSVAMTNCGDRGGYRYARCDPQSGKPWPSLPDIFGDLACRAADRAGFAGYAPDVCLINRYEPGARMSLHQDKDEADFAAPIVSASFGLPAIFLFGGKTRSDRPQRLQLTHGDVVVWGGPARMSFHGVLPLAEGNHPILGRQRLNLTFRHAL